MRATYMHTGKWCIAEVVKAEQGRVFVTYHGWSSKWDEWISRYSVTTTLRYTHTAHTFTHTLITHTLIYIHSHSYGLTIYSYTRTLKHSYTHALIHSYTHTLLCSCTRALNVEYKARVTELEKKLNLQKGAVRSYTHTTLIHSYTHNTQCTHTLIHSYHSIHSYTHTLTHRLPQNNE